MKKLYFDIPFHKSLFFSIGGLFTLFVAITLSLQYYQEKSIRQENLNTLLQEYNRHVARIIPATLTDESNSYDTFDNHPYRLTIIDTHSGKVLLDNSTQDAIVASHLDRPEISQAINNEQGEAYSIRYSQTMDKLYFYAAYRHNNYVIRSSIPYDNTLSNILHVDPRFRYILIIVATVFIIALLIFCYRLGKAISDLDKFARIAEQNRPLTYTEATTNSTLGRITLNLQNTYEALRQAREALTIEEEKLLAHIYSSREGIAIFTHNKQMIVSNNLFIQYINHITDNTIDNNLSDIFTEPLLQEITLHVTRPYDRISNDGSAIIKQIRISKNGLIFVVRGILFNDNSFEISIFDNTEREHEDLLKKQLTQNIAHELKTPVSSIRGYLETILYNNIDPQRQQLFLERSYNQAKRLSDLLNDISMLNRLDESSDLFDKDELNLSSLIAHSIDESSMAIEAQKMHITTMGISPDMCIKGNNSLLYSIFRNLIDNSIAYAGEGCTITINCYHNDDNYYYFSFADNGIGVEEAHLHRLFERFYRVDKGRSRKLGGTGLGLAIVKNAVLFHRGEIMAKNAQGGGLDILFTLRKT